MSLPLRVLLIEGNDDHALIIERLLLKKGRSRVNMSRTTTLKEGLRRIASEGVDIVLLDLRLPDSDGTETIPRALEAAPQTPIIVLTSVEDHELAGRALQTGAQDFLFKGALTSEILFQAIRNAIDRKHV